MMESLLGALSFGRGSFLRKSSEASDHTQRSPVSLGSPPEHTSTLQEVNEEESSSELGVFSDELESCSGVKHGEVQEEEEERGDLQCCSQPDSPPNAVSPASQFPSRSSPFSFTLRSPDSNERGPIAALPLPTHSREEECKPLSVTEYTFRPTANEGGTVAVRVPRESREESSAQGESLFLRPFSGVEGSETAGVRSDTLSLNRFVMSGLQRGFERSDSAETLRDWGSIPDSDLAEESCNGTSLQGGIDLPLPPSSGWGEGSSVILPADRVDVEEGVYSGSRVQQEEGGAESLSEEPSDEREDKLNHCTAATKSPHTERDQVLPPGVLSSQSPSSAVPSPREAKSHSDPLCTIPDEMDVEGEEGQTNVQPLPGVSLVMSADDHEEMPSAPLPLSDPLSITDRNAESDRGKTKFDSASDSVSGFSSSPSLERQSIDRFLSFLPKASADTRPSAQSLTISSPSDCLTVTDSKFIPSLPPWGYFEILRFCRRLARDPQRQINKVQSPGPEGGVCGLGFRETRGSNSMGVLSKTEKAREIFCSAVADASLESVSVQPMFSLNALVGMAEAELSLCGSVPDAASGLCVKIESEQEGKRQCPPEESDDRSSRALLSHVSVSVPAHELDRERLSGVEVEDSQREGADLQRGEGRSCKEIDSEEEGDDAEMGDVSSGEEDGGGLILNSEKEVGEGLLLNSGKDVRKDAREPSAFVSPRLSLCSACSSPRGSLDRRALAQQSTALAENSALGGDSYDVSEIPSYQEGGMQVSFLSEKSMRLQLPSGPREKSGRTSDGLVSLGEEHQVLHGEGNAVSPRGGRCLRSSSVGFIASGLVEKEKTSETAAVSLSGRRKKNAFLLRLVEEGNLLGALGGERRAMKGTTGSECVSKSLSQGVSLSPSTDHVRVAVEKRKNGKRTLEETGAVESESCKETVKRLCTAPDDLPSLPLSLSDPLKGWEGEGTTRGREGVCLKGTGASLLKGLARGRYGHSVCEHGGRWTRCRLCGGGSVCVHGRQRSVCRHCGGGGLCYHGLQRHQCSRCLRRNC